MAFNETKSILSSLIEDLSFTLNQIHHKNPLPTPNSVGENFFLVKENLLWCYYFNQCILNHLYQIKHKILAGAFNNKRHYLESDLHLTSTILDFIIQNQKPENLEPYFSIKKINEILRNQLTSFQELLHYFPEDMAVNYKQAPQEFTAISLDFYQFIHLALLHCQSQLRTIELITKINKIGSIETSKNILT